ncbi:hypothetical protein SG34_005555 [Thalassomonas viridans]|uniref:Uncharacterized protein n=1 Tax=Thalassomonas viridans TaxID=137584 RepID=A0AAF0CA15_9GAMM|nr:hypothetical protein [Thalassomonas viridans]WDE06388.1 hypothetical protein SG34_005555 [Thalassomonas viridans]
MTQTSFWQDNQQTAQYAELCNALYERELAALVRGEFTSAVAIQHRIKSLPYYIKRTAHAMLQSQSPLDLDTVNGSWSAKQSVKMPLSGQEDAAIWQWYKSSKLRPGLVVPVALADRIILDCVDRLDKQGQGFRTNVCGWFREEAKPEMQNFQLLKPNKKVMMAACCGHSWQNNKKARPVIPTLRELLLSCAINWQNFKQSLFI